MQRQRWSDHSVLTAPQSRSTQTPVREANTRPGPLGYLGSCLHTIERTWWSTPLRRLAPLGSQTHNNLAPARLLDLVPTGLWFEHFGSFPSQPDPRCSSVSMQRPSQFPRIAFNTRPWRLHAQRHPNQDSSASIWSHTGRMMSALSNKSIPASAASGHRVINRPIQAPFSLSTFSRKTKSAHCSQLQKDRKSNETNASVVLRVCLARKRGLSRSLPRKVYRVSQDCGHRSEHSIFGE